MKKFFSKAYASVKKTASKCGKTMKCAALAAVGMVFGTVNAAAQALAGTGYDAGTSALEDVATEIAKYVPYVVNLCYALAGVVAIVGAISVYIAMNNEEQDVKNFLLLSMKNEIIGRIKILNTLYIKVILQRFLFSDCLLLSP